MSSPHCNVAAGFSLRQYLLNVKNTFDETFFVNDTKPVFKTITFAPTSKYQQNVGANNPNSEAILKNIEPPACLLDLYTLKTDPNYDEVRHDRTSIFTNDGNLFIYLYMRALVIVSNLRETAHYQVRRLAVDAAGLITQTGRFGAPIGLAQVTSIAEVQELQQLNNHLIGWEVLWQHSVELEAPDYTNPNLRDFPEANADDIYDLNIEILP